MTPDYDIIGTSEAAEILGVAVPQITRLRDNGKMPRPVCELAASDVWMRADVEAVAKGETPPPSKPIKGLLGLKEAADLLGVDKSQIGRWRRAGKFPEPWREVAASPIWLRVDLVTWQKARDRAERARAKAKAAEEAAKEKRRAAREAKAKAKSAT